MSNSEFTLAEDNANEAEQATASVSNAVQEVQVVVETSANDDEFAFLEDDIVDSEEASNKETSSVAVDMSELMDDPEKGNNGVWLSYKGSTEVLVARAGNTKAQAMLSRLYTANRSLIDAGGAQADALSKRIYNEVEAKCIVLGFRNMTFAGQSLVYTPKTALFLLTKSTDFKQWVAKQSQATDNFTRKATEEDIEAVKKLLNGS